MMNYESTVHADNSETDENAPMGTEVERSNKKPLLIGFILLALVAIAAIAIMQYLAATAEPEEVEEQLATVTVVAPGQATIAGEISATGTFAARRALPVGVAGEGGRVVSVPVDAGDWVKAGQVLAYIDRSVQNQQSRSASAQISVSQSDANLAQANLDRALKLVDRGFISKADVDRLTATRDAAAARVRVAQAQLSELQARNSRLNITAPASGLLLQRNVEPGQIVSGGSGALFIVAKGGEMEMMAKLGESELARISTGVSASVTPVGSEKTFSGQVWQIAPTIDAQDRQGTARIALSYAPELRPGGFASAVISSGTVVAPQLPESAVLSDDEGTYVYIIGAENKVEKRRVKTGLITQDGLAIVEGLDGTESVVLRSGGFLNPGETVKPKQLEEKGS